MASIVPGCLQLFEPDIADPVFAGGFDFGAELAAGAEICCVVVDEDGDEVAVHVKGCGVAFGKVGY